MSGDEESKDLSPIEKAARFFRDESVPMGARVGVAGAIALVLTFPLWEDLGDIRDWPRVNRMSDTGLFRVVVFAI